jgi:transketolase
MKNLNQIAKDLRRQTLTMIYNAKSGHPGGSLSCADIFAALFHSAMNLSLDENGKTIDKFVLSKGHASSIYYATLASIGKIDKEMLNGYRRYDSILEGHPSNKIPGVDSSSGSLGQGLSIANGMGLAKKIDEKEGYIYCLLGDGELEEGQVWEAFMSMHKFNLNNIIAIIDNNGLQIDGSIDYVKKIDNIEEKVKSFGINVLTVDGHNIEEILNAIDNIKESNVPTCIIAKTVKGKGVSFMENKIEWHGKSLSQEEYNLAMEELK